MTAPIVEKTGWRQISGAGEKQGWDSIATRVRYDLIVCGRGEGVGAGHQRTGMLLDDGRKSRRDLAFGLRREDQQAHLSERRFWDRYGRSRKMSPRPRATSR